MTTPSNPPRLAVLGAGHTGPVLARVLVESGYPVSIAASGDPEKIRMLVKLLAPGAEARWAADAVADADVVFLAIPLHRFAELDPELLAGRIVVDTMNYWPPVDGTQQLFENPQSLPGEPEGRPGSSEVVQRLLPGSTVVKTLNHIGYHELDESRRPAGDPTRRALGVAGDDAGAVASVAGIVDRVGYDAVRLPGLAAGRALQPGGPVFGAELHRNEFEKEVSA